MKNIAMKTLAALVVAAAFPLTAQAAICTANSDLSNPDASVTNSTSCGEGVRNDANDSAAELSSLTGLSGWFEIDKDDAAGDGNSGALLSTNVPDGTSGAWAFDAQTGYDQYLLVIKDGAVPNPAAQDADTINWFWFIVDVTAGCDTATQTTYSTQDFCGSWTMYGNNGSAKEISHLTLYARDGGGGDDDVIPEPGVLFLMGAGLLGLGMARRRKSA